MVSTRWIVWGVSVILAAAAVAQPFRPIVVSGGSMTPTYRSGELLWTAPVDRSLRRGDVVIVDGPDGPIIKRVALVAGDRRAQWLAAGEWVDTTVLCVPTNPHLRSHVRTCVVPPGTVFLLGDNVQNSIDSRSFGPVAVGRVRRLVLDSRDPSPRSGVAQASPKAWLSQAIRAGARGWVASR